MRLRIVLITTLFALSFVAGAAELPSSSLVGSVGLNIAGNFSSDDTTEFGSILLIEGSRGLAAFNSLGKPSPFLEAVVEIDPGPGIPLITARSTGLLTYYFQIVSPISITLPIAIDVAGSVTGIGDPVAFDANFQLESSWALFDSPSPTAARLTQDIIRTNLQVGTVHQEFSRTVALNVESNHVYRVMMVAVADASARAGMSVSASARIDPIFHFGPGVDPTLFSFSFSDGIGNSPVPLPAPLALLSAGLLALGPLSRRSRRSPKRHSV